MRRSTVQFRPPAPEIARTPGISPESFFIPLVPARENRFTATVSTTKLLQKGDTVPTKPTEKAAFKDVETSFGIENDFGFVINKIRLLDIDMQQEET